MKKPLVQKVAVGVLTVLVASGGGCAAVDARDMADNDMCRPCDVPHVETPSWATYAGTSTTLSSAMTVGASGGPGSVEGQLNVVEQSDMATAPPLPPT
jgi:hypothetical protein